MSAYERGIRHGATVPFNGNTYPTKLTKKDVNVPFNPEQFYIENNFSPLSNGDLYVNMRVRNDTDIIKPAKYYNNLVDKLVDVGNNWKLTVARMDCPSQDIPMFFWNNDGPDAFNITISTRDNLGGVDSHSAIPQYISIRDVDSAITSNKPVWIVSQVVRSINDAINTCCNLFPANHPLNLPTAADAAANRPRLLFNENDLLFTWIFPVAITDSLAAKDPKYADLTWLDTNNGSTTSNATSRLYTNKKLDYLFENFSKIEYNASPVAGHPDALVYIRPYNTYNNLTTLSGIQFWMVEQCHQSLNLWYNLYKLVIVSDNMPIRHEFVSVHSVNGAASADLDTRGILTDLDVAFQYPNYQRISYNPTEFKWIDIITDSALTKLDWQIYYLTQGGDLLPLNLEPGQTCNLKLLFRKK